MKIEFKKVQINSGRYRKGEPFRNRNKIYFFLDGKSVIENLLNRRNRPYEMYRENCIPKLLEYLKDNHPAIYEVVKNEKWSWRQRCGCSCPCSPGFIGDSRFGSQDIYVDVLIK